MATYTFTGQDYIEFYGTNVLNSCIKIGNGALATQILGLVPCQTENLDCYSNCYTMPVFDGDFNSFLFEFVPSVTNADFRLYKQVGNSFNQIAVLSAAEGEIFNIGDIPEYLNYAGYVLDWDKVLNLYGEGVYKFVVFDSINPLLSYPFKLKTASCDSMNGTSKLEVIQRGLYANYNYKKQEGNIKTFDVQAIDWFDSVRLNAKIVPTELTQEIESIKYANDREETFFNQGFQNYDFNVFECDYELFKRFLHFGTKGKDIRISNYNLDAETELIGVNVVATGESESSKFPKNKLLYQLSIKFKDEFLDKYRAC